MSKQALEHQGNTVSAYFAIGNSVYRNLVVQETTDEPADQKAQPLAVIRAIDVTAVHATGREPIDGGKQYSGKKPERIDVVLVIDEPDGTERKVSTTTPVGFTTPEWVANGEDAGLISATETPMGEVTVEHIAWIGRRVLYLTLETPDGCNKDEEQTFHDELLELAAEEFHGKAAGLRQALINNVRRYVLKLLPTGYSAEISIESHHEINVAIHPALIGPDPPDDRKT